MLLVYIEFHYLPEATADMKEPSVGDGGDIHTKPGLFMCCFVR